MNNQELIKKLKEIKTGQPTAEWAERNRELLLSQIRAQQSSRFELFSKNSASFTWQVIQTFFPHRLAARVATAVVLVIILVLGTSVTTVWADRSLSGDILYPIKITTEIVQLTLTPGKEAKAKLNIEFAGKRVEEVEALSQQEDQPVEETAKKIENTLENYKKNIESANDYLQELEDAQVAVELATVIDEQTEEYQESLAKKNISGEEGQIIKDALAVSEEVNDQAVDLIIDKHESGEVAELTEEELAKKVEDKIIKAEAGIDGLKSKIEELEITKGDISGQAEEAEETNVNQGFKTLVNAQQLEEAVSVLEQAKELLESGELSSSLEKIKESNEIVKIAEEAMEGNTIAGQPASLNQDEPVLSDDSLNGSEPASQGQPVVVEGAEGEIEVAAEIEELAADE